MMSITISCFAYFSVQVKEHLEIFANIKGVSEDKIDSVVTEMADEVSYPCSLLGDLTFLLWFNLCSTHSWLDLLGAKLSLFSMHWLLFLQTLFHIFRMLVQLVLQYQNPENAAPCTWFICIQVLNLRKNRDCQTKWNSSWIFYYTPSVALYISFSINEILIQVIYNLTFL